MIHHDIQVWKRNLCGAFYTKWFYQQGTLWRKNNLPNFPPAPKKTQVEGWQPEVEAEFQTNVGNPPATIPMLMQTLRKARPWHFSIGLGFGVQTLGLDWWWDMIYTVYIYMIYIYIDMYIYMHQGTQIRIWCNLRHMYRDSNICM